MIKASTGSCACASTSAGWPANCANSPMKEPGPCVTISGPCPDDACWLTSTLPDNMMVKPSVTLPAFARASFLRYDRNVPKCRTRSISDGSRTGNIWSHRVSMVRFFGTAALTKRLHPHRGDRPEFNHGDEPDQNEDHQHDGLRDRERRLRLRRSQCIEGRNLREALRD